MKNVRTITNVQVPVPGAFENVKMMNEEHREHRRVNRKRKGHEMTRKGQVRRTGDHHRRYRAIKENWCRFMRDGPGDPLRNELGGAGLTGVNVPGSNGGAYSSGLPSNLWRRKE